MSELDPTWIVSEDGKSISRKFTTKNFTDALVITNKIGDLAEEYNHHPEINMGWGFCVVSFTTYSKQRLSNLDFMCAKKVDDLTA